MNEESSALQPPLRPALGEPGIRWSGDGGLGGPAPDVVRPSSAVPVPAQVRLRAFGYAIDFAILVVIGLVIATVIAAIGIDPEVTGAERERQIEELWPVVYVAVAAFQFVYNLVSNTIGWSPGKRMVRLRIVREDGRAPGFRIGLLRTLGSMISNLPLGLGYAWALWDREHRTWHDRISRTWVSREADLEGRTPRV